MFIGQEPLRSLHTRPVHVELGHLIVGSAIIVKIHICTSKSLVDIRANTAGVAYIIHLQHAVLFVKQRFDTLLDPDCPPHKPLQVSMCASWLLITAC